MIKSNVKIEIMCFFLVCLKGVFLIYFLFKMLMKLEYILFFKLVVKKEELKELVCYIYQNFGVFFNLNIEYKYRLYNQDVLIRIFE